MKSPVSLPRRSVGEIIPVPPRKPLPLKDIPAWTKLPYDTKYPLPKIPNKVDLSREDLGHTLFPTVPFKMDFDLSQSSTPFLDSPGYSSLHDPHLRGFFQSQAKYKDLVRTGLITEDGRVLTGLREYNQYRMYLYHLWALQVNQLKQLQMTEEKNRLESLIRAHECGDALFREIVRKYDRIKVEEVLDEIAARLFETDEELLEHDATSPIVQSVIRWRHYQQTLKKSFKQRYPEVKRWLSEQSKHYKLLMEKELNDRTNRERKLQSRWAKIYSRSLARLQRESTLRFQEGHRQRTLWSDQLLGKDKSPESRSDGGTKPKRKREQPALSSKSSTDDLIAKKRLETESKISEDDGTQLKERRRSRKKGSISENDQIPVQLASSSQETKSLYSFVIGNLHPKPISKVTPVVHKLTETYSKEKMEHKGSPSKQPTQAASDKSHKKSKSSTFRKSSGDLAECDTARVRRKSDGFETKIGERKPRVKATSVAVHKLPKRKSCNDLGKTSQEARKEKDEFRDIEGQPKKQLTKLKSVSCSAISSNRQQLLNFLYGLPPKASEEIMLDSQCESKVGESGHKVTSKRRTDNTDYGSPIGFMMEKKPKLISTIDIESEVFELDFQGEDTKLHLQNDMAIDMQDEDRMFDSQGKGAILDLHSEAMEHDSDGETMMLDSEEAMLLDLEGEAMMLDSENELMIDKLEDKAKLEDSDTGTVTSSEYKKNETKSISSEKMDIEWPQSEKCDFWEMMDLSLSKRKQQLCRTLGLEQDQLIARRKKQIEKELLKYQSELSTITVHVPKECMKTTSQSGNETRENHKDQAVTSETEIKIKESKLEAEIEDDTRKLGSNVQETASKQYQPFKFLTTDSEIGILKEMKNKAKRTSMHQTRREMSTEIKIGEKKTNITKNTDQLNWDAQNRLTDEQEDDSEDKAIKPDFELSNLSLFKTDTNKYITASEKQNVGDRGIENGKVNESLSIEKLEIENEQRKENVEDLKRATKEGYQTSSSKLQINKENVEDTTQDELENDKEHEKSFKYDSSENELKYNFKEATQLKLEIEKELQKLVEEILQNELKEDSKDTKQLTPESKKEQLKPEDKMSENDLKDLREITQMESEHEKESQKLTSKEISEINLKEKTTVTQIKLENTKDTPKPIEDEASNNETKDDFLKISQIELERQNYEIVREETENKLKDNLTKETQIKSESKNEILKAMAEISQNKLKECSTEEQQIKLENEIKPQNSTKDETEKNELKKTSLERSDDITKLLAKLLDEMIEDLITKSSKKLELGSKNEVSLESDLTEINNFDKSYHDLPVVKDVHFKSFSLSNEVQREISKMKANDAKECIVLSSEIAQLRTSDIGEEIALIETTAKQELIANKIEDLHELLKGTFCAAKYVFDAVETKFLTVAEWNGFNKELFLKENQDHSFFTLPERILYPTSTKDDLISWKHHDATSGKLEMTPTIYGTNSKYYGSSYSEKDSLTLTLDFTISDPSLTLKTESDFLNAVDSNSSSTLGTKLETLDQAERKIPKRNQMISYEQTQGHDFCDDKSFIISFSAEDIERLTDEIADVVKLYFQMQNSYGRHLVLPPAKVSVIATQKIFENPSIDLHHQLSDKLYLGGIKETKSQNDVQSPNIARLTLTFHKVGQSETEHSVDAMQEMETDFMLSKAIAFKPPTAMCSKLKKVKPPQISRRELEENIVLQPVEITECTESRKTDADLKKRDSVLIHQDIQKCTQNIQKARQNNAKMMESLEKYLKDFK